MTKISNQYSLTNILTADLANSRLGINNVSPTVALDVTGAGKFSGALTGTTATFSGLVSLGGATATNPLNIRTANGESYIRFLNADGSTYGDFERSITGSGAIRFTGAYFRFANQLEVTGAATFSSSVQIGSTLSNSLSVGLAAPTTDTLNQIFAGQGAFGAQATGGETDIGNNWYYYSGFKYRITAPSSNIKLNGDVISFERAASGTANAAISFLESMRITAAGNVGIGLSSTPDKLGVQGTANNWTGKFLGSTVSGNSFGVDIVAGTTDGDYPLYIRTTNYSLRLFVRGDGVCYIGASSWVYNSDRRVKENISDVVNGLDLVSKLKPKHFDYINGAKNNLGFIAQEVQELIPQAVTISDEKTGILGLKTDFIIPYLVKSIQELSAKVSLLENK